MSNVAVSDNAEDELRPWALKRGATIHEAIVARPLPAFGGGFGVVAKRDVPQHTKIASMPASMLVTAKSARAWCSLPSSVPAIDAIIVFLVTERLAALPSSPWHEWVSRLPKRYDNFIELQDAFDVSHRVNDGYPGDEVMSALVAAFMPLPRYREKIVVELRNFHERATRLLSSAARCFAKLCEVLGDPDAHRLVDREILRWAFNSLMSRGFGYSDETWAMVPWVDYFNFSNTATAHASETKSGGFDFVTNGRHKAGAQVFITYGVYTDVELATWYGFTLCSGAHHQSHCGYVFSPLGNTDGEIELGAGWAIRLAKAIGLSSVPPTWRPLESVDLGRCRVHREGCSADMQTLINDVAEANDVPPVVVARRIIEAELEAIPASEHGEAPGEFVPPCARMALAVASDSRDLLQRIAQLNDVQLEQWLHHTVEA